MSKHYEVTLEVDVKVKVEVSPGASELGKVVAEKTKYVKIVALTEDDHLSDAHEIADKMRSELLKKEGANAEDITYSYRLIELY